MMTWTHHTCYTSSNSTRSSRKGVINSPYTCIEWPRIQIPQAILSLLDEKGLRFTFYNNKRVAEEPTLHFYERNLTGRGLDFHDYLDDKDRLC
jgi:hypothetical protein